jgi:hypothetical protein
MFRWLSKLTGSARAMPTREALLNEGLELAMDWGENWLAPIQPRMAQRHPHLERRELDELDAAVQEAMKFGHDTAYALVRAAGQGVPQAEFNPLVMSKYPWLDSENAARLFSQSIYYASKAGGPARGA